MIDWKRLTALAQLDELIELSASKAVGIFKHSSRCFTSFSVKKFLEDRWSIPEEVVELYFLDLIEYRDISDAIAQKFSVTHQSPQLIVVREGKVIYDDSHHKISVEQLENELGLIQE
ncbi:MAG TPA: bacillithiol system redox-active protein YtxJ [Flavobacteriales bacterium]|nr:bacillithiol system redox-active protein YtxJ [Flavobacteriales bacterium]